MLYAIDKMLNEKIADTKLVYDVQFHFYKIQKQPKSINDDCSWYNKNSHHTLKFQTLVESHPLKLSWPSDLPWQVQCDKEMAQL